MSIRPSLPLAGLLLAVALPLSAAQPGAAKGATQRLRRQAGRHRGEAGNGPLVLQRRPGGRLGKGPLRGQGTLHRAGLLRENKQKVIDSEREVSEREKDLRKAMGKGDPEKIEKRKAKLAEARAELEEAKKGLEQAQAQ